MAYYIVLFQTKFSVELNQIAPQSRGNKRFILNQWPRFFLKKSWKTHFLTANSFHLSISPDFRAPGSTTSPNCAARRRLATTLYRRWRRRIRCRCSTSRRRRWTDQPALISFTPRYQIATTQKRIRPSPTKPSTSSWANKTRQRDKYWGNKSSTQIIVGSEWDRREDNLTPQFGCVE